MAVENFTRTPARQLLATEREPMTLLHDQNVADFVTGAPATVDSVATVDGDRVLCTGQSAGAENGYYYVTTAGTLWERAGDADQSFKIQPGMSCRILKGTAYAGKLFYLSTTGTIVLDTTALTFTEHASGGAGGTGGNTANMTYSDTTTDADPGSGTIRLNNTTLANATEAYVDDDSADGIDLQLMLAGKGQSEFTIAKADLPLEHYATFECYGVEEETGYWRLLLKFRDDAGSLSDGDDVIISFDIHDEEDSADNLTNIIVDDFFAGDAQSLLSAQWEDLGVDSPAYSGRNLRWRTSGADLDGLLMNRRRLLSFDINIEVIGSREDKEKAEFRLIACAERYGLDFGAHYSLEWPAVTGAADPNLYYTDVAGTKNLLSAIAGLTFDSTTRTIAWRIEVEADADVKHSFDLAGSPVTTYTHTSGHVAEGYIGMYADVDFSTFYAENEIEVQKIRAWSTELRAFIATW